MKDEEKIKPDEYAYKIQITRIWAAVLIVLIVSLLIFAVLRN